MRKLKKVGLSLENCELLMFDSSDVLGLHLTNVVENKLKIGDDIVSMPEASNVKIVISSKGNKRHGDSLQFDSEDWDYTLFERMMEFQDIVSVVLCYEDGTEEEIYVKWCEDGYVNELQQSYIDKTYGNLHVLIGEVK